MGFGFKQPLVGEKRCVTTLITAAEETMLSGATSPFAYLEKFSQNCSRSSFVIRVNPLHP